MSNDFLRRLIEFYRASCDSPQLMSGIWQSVTATYHAGLISALKSGDCDAVQKALDAVYPNGLFGIDDLVGGSVHPLAYKLGIIPLHNPEQVSLTENFGMPDETKTRMKIEEALGFKLGAPPCFGAGGGFGNRFVFYCIAAATMKQRLSGDMPYSILEIGGGIGDLAVISNRWGALNWTDIDIPSTAVMAAHFVATCLGENRVWLYGEPGNNAFARFYPFTDYSQAWVHRYDLAFNSDSFPEIPADQQDNYLELIYSSLTSYGVFLSINHESDNGQQSSVFDAMKRSGKFQLLSRYPFIGRTGYIEEIYGKLALDGERD